MDPLRSFGSFGILRSERIRFFPLADIGVFSEEPANNANISLSLNHLKGIAINNHDEGEGSNTGVNSTQMESSIKNVVSTVFLTEKMLVSSNQKDVLNVTSYRLNGVFLQALVKLILPLQLIKNVDYPHYQIQIVQHLQMIKRH